MFPRYAYLGLDAPLPAAETPAWRYHQEGSLGMVFEPLAPGCPIEVTGMHPERPRVGWRLPAPPAIEIEVAGRRERVAPRLTAVVVRPDEERAALVYCARTASLPRIFLPGVHPHIPLAVRIDGGPPVAYPSPPVRRPAAGAAGRAPAAERQER